MKRITSIAFVSALFFTAITFNANATDSSWKLKTDKSIYSPGEFIELKIINSNELPYKFQEGRIHITFNNDLIEYASYEDEDFQNAFPEAGGTVINEIAGSYMGDNQEKDGEYIVSIAVGSPATILSNASVFTIYFKVKENIYGSNMHNFNLIMGSDFPTYAAFNNENQIMQKYNIESVNHTVTIQGDAIEDPTELSDSQYFVPAVCPNKENPITFNINGETKVIDTPYGVAFSKIAVKNTAKAVKAGILFTKNKLNDDTLKIGAVNVNNAEALSISSKNLFGVLFYGPGVKANTTYYLRSYVIYDDGSTLYAPVCTITIGN